MMKDEISFMLASHMIMQGISTRLRKNSGYQEDEADLCKRGSYKTLFSYQFVM
jgi:hypothetical protein